MGKPEIRFKEFTDDWEQRKLGEVIEDYVEKTTVENQYPVLTSSQQMGIVLQDDYFSGDRVSQSGNIGYFVIPRGYFAYRSRSDNDVFVFNRNDCIDKGSISYFYPVFKPSGVDSDFLLRRLNYGLETQLKIASEGTGQHVLSLKKFKNMTALFPSINEQRKIGEYFTRLDHLITLHQRKCDEVKTLKKYMLQKMFPQNGMNIPEIRFSGFTDVWEQRKFPEFVSFFNGLTYTPDDVQDTGTLVLRSSNVKNGEIVDADNVYVSDKVVISENVQKGDIIVVVRNGSRALIGKHAQIKAFMPNTVIGAFMTGLRSEQSSFVNALLDTSAFEKEIAKNMGATINQITGYMFSKMEFMIPSEKEQQKIGDYFTNLDHLITLHQRKCDELRKMKKFMLQNMFPKE